MSTMQEFDLSKFAAHEPSLVLPYVYTNVATSKIEEVITELELGEIRKIDRIERTNNKTGRTFNVVFVHFKAWSDNEDATGVRQLLLNEEEAQIYYHDNWYWKARAYAPKVKPKPERKPRMEFVKSNKRVPKQEGYQPHSPTNEGYSSDANSEFND